jgi:hypothetical protein
MHDRSDRVLQYLRADGSALADSPYVQELMNPIDFVLDRINVDEAASPFAKRGSHDKEWYDNLVAVADAMEHTGERDPEVYYEGLMQVAVHFARTRLKYAPNSWNYRSSPNVHLDVDARAALNVPEAETILRAVRETRRDAHSAADAKEVRSLIQKRARLAGATVTGSLVAIEKDK